MVLSHVDFFDDLHEPVDVLLELLRVAGLMPEEAVLSYSFFIDPEAVRQKSPYFPDCARKSRAHYPNVDRGGRAVWKEREVRIGDNARAQMAWAKYTGRAVHRGSGYGVRHIWGHPWDPDVFTAGWNLCYMPFWLGMLTEDQHPLPAVVTLLQQVSWDLYFSHEPVCAPPSFVINPGVDLSELTSRFPVQFLKPKSGGLRPRRTPPPTGNRVDDTIRAIRAKRSASWSNLIKAAKALLEKEHEPFGTTNVEATSKSVVRLIARETGLSLEDIERALLRLAGSR
jgi:hypothetical protein